MNVNNNHDSLSPSQHQVTSGQRGDTQQIRICIENIFHYQTDQRTQTHPQNLFTWRSRWYFRTLCIGTTSRSLRVNFPLLALLEHSWNKYNSLCHFTLGYWDFKHQGTKQCICHSVFLLTVYFRAMKLSKLWGPWHKIYYLKQLLPTYDGIFL